MEKRWDFELDNIISVPAVDGVDPENMTNDQWTRCHGLLLERLKTLIEHKEITFSFEKAFSPDSGVHNG